MAIQDDRLKGLLKYWRSKRGARLAPARSQILPDELRDILPWLTLLDVEDGAEGQDFRYRLVGTAVDMLHGRSLTGLRVGDVWVNGAAEQSLDFLRRVVRGKAPICGHWFIRYPSIEMRMESLMLPLSTDGVAVDKLMGASVYRPLGNAAVQSPLPEEAHLLRVDVEIHELAP